MKRDVVGSRWRTPRGRLKPPRTARSAGPPEPSGWVETSDGGSWYVGGYSANLVVDGTGGSRARLQTESEADVFVAAVDAADIVTCAFDLGSSGSVWAPRLAVGPEGHPVVAVTFDRALALDAWPDSEPVTSTPPDSGDIFVGRLAPAERCDGSDGDLDGLVGCADPDCPGSPTCFEGGCADGLDADGDGLVDCADFDCEAAPSCGGCAAVDLGSALGLGLAAGVAAGASDDLWPLRCVGDGLDRAYRWTAPATGTYRFRVRGDGEATLSVRRGGCTGPELACAEVELTNDKATPQITLDVAEGEPLLLVVDGLEPGDVFELDVVGFERDCGAGADEDGDGLAGCADPDCAGDAACPDACVVADLGSAVGEAVASGTTAGGASALTGTCGGDGPEVAYRWAAPEGGTYHFAVDGGGGDPVLHVRAGSCAGEELACNDDGPDDLGAVVTLTLAAGEDVVVVVDSYWRGMEFVLSVERE